MKVFLGGTCNESTWRDELEPLLEVDYFNPVVDDWDDDAFEKELQEKNSSDIRLYHITPKMTGVYSIAEAVNDSFNEDVMTVFSYQTTDGDESFDEGQLKSLQKTGELIDANGGIVIEEASMEDVATVLNEIKNYGTDDV